MQAMFTTEVQTRIIITEDEAGPTTPYFIEFLDEKSRRVAEIIMQYVVCFGFGLLGIVTNTLVIIVYAK